MLDNCSTPINFLFVAMFHSFAGQRLICILSIQSKHGDAGVVLVPGSSPPLPHHLCNTRPAAGIRSSQRLSGFCLKVPLTACCHDVCRPSWISASLQPREYNIWLGANIYLCDIVLTRVHFRLLFGFQNFSL